MAEKVYEIHRVFGPHAVGKALAHSYIEAGGYDPAELVRRGWITPTDRPADDFAHRPDTTPDVSAAVLAEHRSLRGEANRLREDVRALSAKCADAEARHKALTGELANKVAELGRLREAVAERDAQVAQLHKDLEQATAPAAQP